jgi:cytochrome c oxidase subunit 3
MWTFIATEVMLFGALFLAYTACRLVYHPTFAAAGRHLDRPLGSLNTAVLLGSSLTMALAVGAARAHGRHRRLVGYLLATIGLGLVFLVIKGIEYSQEYDEGLIPWSHFTWDGADAPHAQLFFLFYFLLTGLHALHLLIGIVVVTGTAILAHRGRFPPENSIPVDMVGLYWHFVDVVWIFILPALYLIH